jgi:hypothetical protein
VNFKKFAIGLIAGLSIISLGACGSSTKQSVNQDRANVQPDSWGEATNVDAFKNADNVPTLVLFCAGGYRFYATLSSDGAKDPNLGRLPEQDGICKK